MIVYPNMEEVCKVTDCSVIYQPEPISSDSTIKKSDIVSYVITKSTLLGIDPNKILFTIKKESEFRPNVVNTNDCNSKESKNCGCSSRGLVQIRDCSHPTVTDEMAFDPIFSVDFLLKNIDKCNTWWRNTCGKYSTRDS